MDIMQIGKKIKEARKNRGLTQEQLAEIVGIHEKQISKIETNKSFPTRKNLIKILDALNLNINEIDVDLTIESEVELERIQAYKIINSAKPDEIKLYSAVLKEMHKHFRNFV